MVALDLTDGYFHLDMAEESRTYMAFRIGKRLFRMAAVPFGWNHAPSAFTKLLEPVVAHLRQPQRAEQREVSRTQKHIPLRRRAGHRHARLLWYMDDFLLAGRTAKETAALRDGAAGLFAKLGLTLQQEKCVWEPTQRLKHLGLIVDTKLGIFQVDEGKADKLRRLARDLLCEAQRSQRKVRKRELAAFAGLGQFVHLALRPARFHLREIYDVIGTLQGWNGRVALTKQALRDLRWWARLRAEDTGCPIWRPIETATLHTDSSGFAWGAVLDGKLEARGYWTSEEAEDHITLNELRAVTRAVTTFRSQLEGKTVQHFEDNMGVVHIINGLTTRSPAIMAELRLLWRVLDLNGINLLTDRPVRDGTEYATTAVQFALGAPGAEAVNSLALSDEHWRSEKNWCNPPWSLLPTLADKLEQSGAAATVVTPDWPRENWAKLDALAIEVTRIPAHTGLFIPGRRRTAHGAGAPRWDVVRQYKVQQGAIAPWAGAIRKRMERIAPGDPDGLTDWIAQSLSAGSYHLGYRQRPAIGALVKSMKQAYGRKVIRIRPAPRILVMPARIILDMWRRVEELTALPDLEYITKLPEIRALLACIVCYITGSRPSSIALLPLTGVAFALGSELGIQRSYVKTAPDACDFDVPGRRTVSWPVTATWQTLGRMLMRYDRMRRRVCSRATYFFNLGEKARGDAFARWLPVARERGSAAPPNGHYAPKSFRSGFASAVTAMNVSPDRRNYIAGWAANSHAVGTHYVDNSVVVDDAARFLFGHLIGLPPPPVEVPVAPVAPWSSPLANLASRLVTLVSPLRGDT
ncbi:RNA-dependent DNA polymerase [Pseudoscourfieldia marina]